MHLATIGDTTEEVYTNAEDTPFGDDASDSAFENFTDILNNPETNKAVEYLERVVIDSVISLASSTGTFFYISARAIFGF